MRLASTPSSADATHAPSHCSPSVAQGPCTFYRVAEKLGIRELIAPFAAGVASSIGLLAAPLAFDFVRTAAARVSALDWTLVGRLLQDMEREGRDLLRQAGVTDTEIKVERAADMRLIGQAHEITVESPGAAPVPAMKRALSKPLSNVHRPVRAHPTQRSD